SPCRSSWPPSRGSGRPARPRPSRRCWWSATWTSTPPPAPRRGPRWGGKRWQRLPGTRREGEAVQALFRRPDPAGRAADLRGRAATAEALRQRAGVHACLHLATHDFFAPASLRSALDFPPAQPGSVDPFAGAAVSGWHPGLLSGLALAGANQGGGVLTA